MLQPGKLSADIKTFISSLNSSKQENKEVCIQTFCDQMEKCVYDAIKSITVTILTGGVIVVGSSTTQTNAAPIVLTDVVS